MPFDGSIRKICCCGCHLADCPRTDARTYDSVHESHIAFSSLPRPRSPHSSAPLFHLYEPLWLCRGLAKWQMGALSALSRCCRGACPPAPAEKRKQDKTQQRHCHIAARSSLRYRDRVMGFFPRSLRAPECVIRCASEGSCGSNRPVRELCGAAAKMSQGPSVSAPTSPGDQLGSIE